MVKKLTGVYVEVEKAPQIVTVADSLEQLQSMVGGNIEVIAISRSIFCILDEEGLLKEKEVNFHVDRYGAIHGNVFFVSALGENFISLDKEQIMKLTASINRNRNIIEVGDFE